MNQSKTPAEVGCNEGLCSTELAQVLRDMAATLEKQVELLNERATGKFLDKQPVVRSLMSHARKARAALAKYEGQKP